MTYERVELPVGALRDIETYAQAARMDPADMAGDLFRSGLTLFDELAQAKGWAMPAVPLTRCAGKNSPSRWPFVIRRWTPAKCCAGSVMKSACRPKHWPAVRFFVRFMTGSARSSHNA